MLLQWLNEQNLTSDKAAYLPFYSQSSIELYCKINKALLSVDFRMEFFPIDKSTNQLIDILSLQNF